MAWLTRGGSLAAALVGAAVLWGAGWPGVALLGAFFVSSSLLTKGGGRRNALQVLANGGVAAAGALLALRAPGPGGAVLAGALAAATADTWATEIGAFSRALPRSVLTWRPVPPGTSGGMTLLGTAGGAAGAALMAALAGQLDLVGASPVLLALAGVGGMVADSVLGAAAQATYRCSCGAVLEVPRHGCGGTVELSKGVRWLNNDGVNFLATATGGFLAWLACC